MDADGKDIYHEPMRGSASGEAINGLAMIGPFMAVATRKEITLWEFFPPQASLPARPYIFPHGAHGMLTTRGGYFVAPLGRTGIMVAKTGVSLRESVSISSMEREGLSFYQGVVVPAPGQRDIVAFACRSAGVVITEFGPERQAESFAGVEFQDQDVVDICTIGTEPHPRSAVAVGQDGTMMFFRDLASTEQPLELKFDEILGKVYRLVSASGHLFMLTSESVYCLLGLAERFFNAAPSPTPITASTMMIPVQGIDMAACLERWLLIVTSEGVDKYDIREIEENEPKSMGPIKRVELRQATQKSMSTRMGMQQRNRREPVTSG